MTLKEKVFQNDTIVQLEDKTLWLVVNNGNVLLGRTSFYFGDSFDDNLAYSNYLNGSKNKDWNIKKAWKIVNSNGYAGLYGLLEIDYIHAMVDIKNMVEIEIRRPKELTVRQIEDLLGFPVKIVK